MKVVKKIVKTTNFVIELTEEEAYVIRVLCGGITGDCQESYRAVTDAIYNGLDSCNRPDLLGYIENKLKCGKIDFVNGRLPLDE